MNSFGRLFRIHIFGESHGSVVGVQIDGCPAGLPIRQEDFLADLNRRKPGAKGTTPRVEKDLPILETGIFNGYTSGAPLTILFKNDNTRSKDYSNLKTIPRPGHADFTAKMKFGGYNDYRGGGHFSGRLTLGLVAAGVVAKKMIPTMNISAHLAEAGGIKDIDKAIENAMDDHDSVGGIVECSVTNLIPGLGEPFFDSIESVLSHLIFSIPAIKGVEFGSGFKSAAMRGSEHNDEITGIDGKTSSNNAGGINGGITNGNDLTMRVAVKPTSSISKKQQSINMETKSVEKLEVKGRHDSCIALRVPVVLEAVVAIGLVDLMMMENKIERVISHQ